MLQRVANIFERVLFLLAGAGMLGSVGLAFTAVILRYVFNQSLEWIEEGARYLALFAALLVAGPVARNGGHVALDLLTSGLQGKARELHRLAVAAITLAVGSAILVWGTRLVIQTQEFGMRTGSLQFPQWLPFSIVPVGMAFLVLFSLFEIAAASSALRAGSETPSSSDGTPGDPGSLDGRP
ncbi:MAG: TRAP transporter small permease subunit [Gemmatimonadales bacterium]|nr:TRAP transporter small permease subunit [Gemmatimonadales bacterium]